MSAKQQNREPAKQYVSKTTKQCVNTTAKRQNRDFSQYFSQSVLQSVSISVSQSVFLNKTPCGLSFFYPFCSRCRLRERVVRLFRLAGEQAGTGRDIRPVFESPEHYMFGTQQAVFSVTRNIFDNAKPLARKGSENASEVVVFLPGPRWPAPKFSHRRSFERPSQKTTYTLEEKLPFQRGKRTDRLN